MIVILRSLISDSPFKIYFGGSGATNRTKSTFGNDNMKKRIFIFAGVFVVIFAAIAIVAAVVGARPTSMAAAPEDVREWARESYEELFTGPLGKFPTLKTNPVPSYTIDTSKPDKVKIEWENTDDSRSMSQFGIRVDAGAGGREVKLPDGQTLTFVAVGVHFQGDPMISKYEGEVTWYDPSTLEPITDPDALGLPVKMQVNADKRELITVFSISDSAKPVRWHFLQAKDGKNLASIHSSSSFQAINDMRFYSLELDIFHQTSVDLLLSISYGEPEVKVIDLRKNDLTTPVMFAGGDAQIAIMELRNGNQNSSGWGGGTGNRYHEFRWSKAGSKSREKSFGLIGVWPSIHAQLMEWRLKGQATGKNQWRSVYGRNGFEKIGFPTELSGISEIEVRYFPKVVHSVFRLAEIPGAREVDNQFAQETGPITFEYRSELGRFVSKVTQTSGLNIYDIWPQTAFPMELDNTSPAALVKEAEARSGKKFYFNSSTLKFEEPPAPLTERLADWLKGIF